MHHALVRFFERLSQLCWRSCLMKSWTPINALPGQESVTPSQTCEVSLNIKTNCRETMKSWKIFRGTENILVSFAVADKTTFCGNWTRFLYQAKVKMVNHLGIPFWHEEKRFAFKVERKCVLADKIYYNDRYRILRLPPLDICQKNQCNIHITSFFDTK